MQHSEFIKALGGGTAVAARLSELTGKDVDREAVYKWNEFNNVPWRWRHHVARIAREKEIALPDGFLPGAEEPVQ